MGIRQLNHPASQSAPAIAALTTPIRFKERYPHHHTTRLSLWIMRRRPRRAIDADCGPSLGAALGTPWTARPWHGHGFHDYLMERARKYGAVLENLSDRQRAAADKATEAALAENKD